MENNETLCEFTYLYCMYLNLGPRVQIIVKQNFIITLTEKTVGKKNVVHTVHRFN